MRRPRTSSCSKFYYKLRTPSRRRRSKPSEPSELPSQCQSGIRISLHLRRIGILPRRLQFPTNRDVDGEKCRWTVPSRCVASKEPLTPKAPDATRGNAAHVAIDARAPTKLGSSDVLSFRPKTKVRPRTRGVRMESRLGHGSRRRLKRAMKFIGTTSTSSSGICTSFQVAALAMAPTY